MTYTVKNGNRTIKFDGSLLSESSSERPDSSRWVEFRLYLTLGGSYVLERVGVSNVYHGLACPVVDRNRLKYDPNDETLEEFHSPCAECEPDLGPKPYILEKDRYYSLVTNDPQAVINSLYKHDNGTTYMTKVTERLIETAIQTDDDLRRAYLVEYID